MAKNKEPLDAPDVVRDIGTIKRLTAATLIVMAIAGLLIVGSEVPRILQLIRGGNPDKVQAYIGKHRDEVKKVFETEEGLKFADLVLAFRQGTASKKVETSVWLDVLVTVDTKKPIDEFADERLKKLKEKIDAILADPPIGAKVRLKLRSETVID